MKLNEKIGLSFVLVGICTMFWNLYDPQIYKIVILVLCLFGQNIFLSYWGLTTFNDKFKN